MDYEQFKGKLIKHMDGWMSDYDAETFEDWLSNLEEMINGMLDNEE